VRCVYAYDSGAIEVHGNPNGMSDASAPMIARKVNAISVRTNLQQLLLRSDAVSRSTDACIAHYASIMFT
jgi:hypothetical protein